MIVIILAIAFVFIGFAIHKLKWHFLISGYNMMATEEKADVNIDGLAAFMAKCCYILAILFAMMAIAEWQNAKVFIWPLISLIVVFSLWMAIKSQSYYRHNANNEELQSKDVSKRIRKPIIIAIASVLIAGIALFFAMKPTTIELQSDRLTISGMYGKEFAFEDISELTLVEKIPAISMRTNGSAVGSKLKGHFKFTNGDNAILFVDENKPPFITFKANEEQYYFNMPETDETTAMFAKLQELVGVD